MARTKQTSHVVRGGKNPTIFPRGGGNPGSGGKAPQGIQQRRRVRPHTGKIPPALQIVRENAACHTTGANATPQGYYKPSDQQKKFKWRPGTRALWEI